MKKITAILFSVFLPLAAFAANFGNFTPVTSITGSHYTVGYIGTTETRYLFSSQLTYFNANLSLDWARIASGKPTTLAGYGIADAVSTGGSYANPSWITSLAASKVGLGNVDNTSDANKPISTATQTALNLKADLTAIAANNASGVNTDGLLHWSQLVGVPAGFADGTDDGETGGGDPFALSTVPSTLGGFIFFGDSLTQGDATTVIPATSAWTYAVANALSAPKYMNFGKGGRKSSDLLSYYTAEVRPARDQHAGQTQFLFLWVGTNDCIQGVSAATLQANITTLCANAIADGYRVVCFTIPPNGHVGGAATFDDTVQTTVNTWLRANQSLLQYTALIDVALMFPNPADATYYNADQTHLNAAANLILASGAGLNGIPSIATTLTPFLPSGTTPAYVYDAAGQPLVFNFNTTASPAGSVSFTANKSPVFSITPNQILPNVPFGYWRFNSLFSAAVRDPWSTIQNQYLPASSATLSNYALAQSEWGDTYLNSGVANPLPAGQTPPKLHLQYQGSDVLTIGSADRVDMKDMWSFKTRSSASEAVMGIYSVNLDTQYALKHYSNGTLRINSGDVLHFEIAGVNKMDLQPTGLVVDGNVAGQNAAFNGLSTTTTSATIGTAFYARNNGSGSGYLVNAALNATYNNDFCLYQSTAGQTYLNAKTGQTINFAINSSIIGQLSSTAGNFTVPLTLNKVLWNATNGNTIGGGGTLTLGSGNTVTYATFSGATATIALPTAVGTQTLVVEGTSTYNSGNQTITVPSLIRPEKDIDTPETSFVIPPTASGRWRVQFNAVNGVWITFSVVGDTLGQTAQTPVEFCIACSDETTAVTTGTAKATFRAPYAFTITSVRASVGTAPTGSTLIVDINEGGSTIMTTNKLSIDATEKTSTTAATAAALTDTAIADDAEITIDIDQVGSTVAGAGVKVWILGYR